MAFANNIISINFPRSNKLKNTYNENSCYMPILSFNISWGGMSYQIMSHWNNDRI